MGGNLEMLAGSVLNVENIKSIWPILTGSNFNATTPSVLQNASSEKMFALFRGKDASTRDRTNFCSGI